MSITSSNNLAVNNSLTVNGNTILGTNSANSLICNATTTFNNPLTLNGNFIQNSGTLSTTSDTNYLNGNVVINGSKTLTTGSGITTINGITQANHDIMILTGASLYVSNASLTKYLRVHHDLINSYIDYVGDMILRKNGTTTAMSIASSDNKATFPYGLITNTINVSGTASCAELNCSSINNTGTLATGVLEITSTSSPCYIDMKTTGNNLDYDVRIASSDGTVGIAGQGTLTITSASTIINSPLNVNSSVNCTSINNSGQLTQTGGDVVLSSGRSVYVTDGGINYVRLHNSGTASVLDFTGGLSIRNGGATTPLSISSSNNQGTFNYNLNTTGITNSTNALINNGVFTQNNTSSFSSAITAPSITSSGTFYAGSFNEFDATSISSPKVINGIASGPADGASYTAFNLAINSWNGVGFVYSNSASPSVCKLVIDNRTGNLSTLGTLTANAISVPNITTSSITTSSTSTINGIINNSTYNGVYNYVLKGTTYCDGTGPTDVYVYTYTKNGVSGSSSNETFGTSIGVNLVRIKYKYETPVSGGGSAMGYQEYIFIKRLSDFPITWIQYQTSQVGNNTIYQPTFTVTSSSINIAFAINTSTSAFVHWSYEIEMV